MLTDKEVRAIYWRVLSTPPFSDCFVRITAEINKLIAQKISEGIDTNGTMNP